MAYDKVGDNLDRGGDISFRDIMRLCVCMKPERNVLGMRARQTGLQQRKLFRETTDCCKNRKGLPESVSLRPRRVPLSFQQIPSPDACTFLTLFDVVAQQPIVRVKH